MANSNQDQSRGVNQEQDSINAFAAEAAQRYDAFIEWMIKNWRQQGDPLTPADFTAGKRELDLLLGAKLHADINDRALSALATNPVEVDDGQYRPVTPAPWP